MPKYGVIDVEATDDDRVKKFVACWNSQRLRVRRRIWWPRGATFKIAQFFGAPQSITSSKGGELQLADTIALLLSRATPSTSWSMVAFDTTLAIPPASFPPASSAASATRSTVQLCSSPLRSC